MKADPVSEDYYKQEEILERISKRIKSNNLKHITIINKYDEQPLTFVYDSAQKICYNIEANNKTIHVILVKYSDFIDEEGNFIYD